MPTNILKKSNTMFKSSGVFKYKKFQAPFNKLIRTQMNTDKEGIINKIKNLCLPRPPCEQGESGGSVQIRVPKT